MANLRLFIFVLFSLYGVLVSSYEVKKFRQKIDHFGLIRDSRDVEATFVHKYILITDFFTPTNQSEDSEQEDVVDDDEGLSDYRNHTIFLYTGGHGPIEEFYNKSGFVLELAKEYGALVVFAEHRFYGESLPFGNDSFSVPTLGYLNVDQILADYLNLLYFIKYDNDIPTAKVITFGTSYAGSLAAYMRFKFPNEVTGALASGAPIKMADNQTAQFDYWPRLTSIYQNLEIGDVTVATVRQGFDTIAYLNGSIDGRKDITSKFNLCESLTVEMTEALMKTIRDVFSQLALHNYPYANGRYPKNAVAWSAEVIYNATLSTQSLSDLIYWYYQPDNLDDCFDLNKAYIGCADQTGCAVGTQGIAWDFELCREIKFVLGSDYSNSMFPNLPYSLYDQLVPYCNDKFPGIPKTQRFNDFVDNFWGSDVTLATNIIWTNGLLDPYYSACIVDESTNLGAMVGAGPGLDLRTPVEGDGMEVYRDIEMDLVGQILEGTFKSDEEINVN